MVIRVHNIKEAKALLKEAYNNGTIFDYDKSTWTSHDGSFICESSVLDSSGIYRITDAQGDYEVVGIVNKHD